MSTGIFFNGRYLPPMMGGSDEDGGGSFGGADSTPSFTSAGGSLETAFGESGSSPTPSFDKAPLPTLESAPEAEATSTTSTPAASPSGAAAPQPLTPDAYAPRPLEHVHQQVLQLELQHQRELDLIQAHGQYLPADQGRELITAFQQRTLERQSQILQLQDEARRAQIEPVVRELAVNRLVELAQVDNKGIDSKKMTAHLKAFAEAGMPAQYVMFAAQQYAADHRDDVLQKRATKGTDRMGSGAASSTNTLANMSTMDKLSLGYSQSAKSARR